MEELSLTNTILASISASKGKKGLNAYLKIRRRLLERIEELRVDESKLTVFQRIKRNEKKSNTLFDKLKTMDKGR